jgi:hypothetical protein
MDIFLAFKNSVKRALSWLHADKEKRREQETENVDMSQQLEKGDIPAMIISALIVILPVALLALLILALFGWFFFVR